MMVIMRIINNTKPSRGPRPLGGSCETQVSPNPMSMKGWVGLVKERIEHAQQEGHLRSIKGRSKPLVRSVEEHNPLITREGFLMNQIVQGQVVPHRPIFVILFCFRLEQWHNAVHKAGLVYTFQ
ncbi:hypothetical protein BGW80DRAFT_1360850 [Lactifluus volemus]|nr:hypothetical protein BGW80DRAFT_1360850 [Lactifluus volemus]